jgi:hypothetical protein
VVVAGDVTAADPDVTADVIVVGSGAEADDATRVEVEGAVDTAGGVT